MIDNTTVFYESQISIVINDMDWSYKMCGIFLSNFYVFVSANIVAVEIYSWALVEKIFITSKFFIISILDFKLLWLKFPYVLPQVVVNSVFKVVVVREVLLWMG